MGIVALVLWMLPPDAGPVAGQELGDESEEEDGKKKEDPPDCNDPGNIGHPMCWTATPTPRPTATPRPPTPTPDPCYNPWHCVPTATPTPTPVPSGSLGASPATIYVASSTTLTASNVSPSGMAVKIEYPSPAMTTGSCTGSGGKGSITSKSYVDVPSDLSGVSMRGCSTGTHQLRLLTKTGNVELAKVSVSVVNRAAPDPDPDPPTPVPTLTASLRATTTTITRGNSTEVEVHSVSPDNAALRIQHSSWLKRGSACATQQAEPAAVTIEYSFNGPRTFSFTGCGVGTHTVKLLPKVGSTVLGTVSIKVEAKPPPSTPTLPNVRITKVLPGTTGVYVEVSWNQTPPADLSELKLSWDQTSGFLCSKPKVSCEGERTLATSSSAVTGYTVQNGKFVHDSDYTKFKVVAKGTGGATYEGHFRDNKGNDKFIRTHRIPKLMVIKGRQTNIELGSVSWEVFDHAEVRLAGATNAHGYEVAVHLPAGTGLQLKDSASEGCTYKPTWSPPHLWPTPALVYKPMRGSFYLVRCSIGDWATDLTLMGRLKEGNNTYSVGTYVRVEDLRHSRHQSDHTVKYVLGTMPPTATPTRTPSAGSERHEPYHPTPTPIPTPAFPAAIATAAATWDGLSNGTDVRFCKNDTCGSYNVDGQSVSVNVVTPIPIPTARASGFITTNPCRHGQVACTSRGTTLNDSHIGRQSMFMPHPLHYSKKFDSGVTYEQKSWTDLYHVAEQHEDYRYLPALLLHEFGHTAGLGHSVTTTDVMHPGEYDPQDLSATDKKALEMNYRGHRANHPRIE